jgi:hypothetical protein
MQEEREREREHGRRRKIRKEEEEEEEEEETLSLLVLAIICPARSFVVYTPFNSPRRSTTGEFRHQGCWVWMTALERRNEDVMETIGR